MLQPSRAPAEWWKRTPTDFEECAEDAAKAAVRENKTAALAACSSKFAGRRKPGGGYTYYDFLQDRSFDIAGPNPTPEEQRYIDQQYTLYLEKQRRNSIEAAISAKQQQQEEREEQQQQVLQQASLRAETERVPIPQARPSILPSRRECAKHPFSCEWPRLTETIHDLRKKLFGGTPSKGRKS